MQDHVQTVRDYYNQNAEAEYNRIANRPEFLITKRYLDRYIAPGDRVLDIGGGSGRYSLYLTEKGCDVTLLDLSEESVSFAAEQAKKQNLPLRTLQGDAREADTLLQSSFDHILLMGPLYHLLEEADRVKAVNTALRLLKPGGLLFASFISMCGGLIYALRDAPEALMNSNEEMFLTQLTEGKSYAGAAFTQAFFIQQNDVLPFMRRFPLDILHLFGQESVLAPNEKTLMLQPPEVFEALLDIAERLAEREEFLSWADHLMVIGRFIPSA